MVANVLSALRRLGHGDSRVIAWVRMSQNGKKKSYGDRQHTWSQLPYSQQVSRSNGPRTHKPLQPLPCVSLLQQCWQDDLQQEQLKGQLTHRSITATVAGLRHESYFHFNLQNI